MEAQINHQLLLYVTPSGGVIPYIQAQSQLLNRRPCPSSHRPAAEWRYDLSFDSCLALGDRCNPPVIAAANAGTCLGIVSCSNIGSSNDRETATVSNSKAGSNRAHSYLHPPAANASVPGSFFMCVCSSSLKHQRFLAENQAGVAVELPKPWWLHGHSPCLHQASQLRSTEHAQDHAAEALFSRKYLCVLPLLGRYLPIWEINSE